MSFVPNHTLSKLVCINCKNYLSHFPIYIHPERGSFCGRCPKPIEPNTTRNDVYEYIAEFQKFPCRFDSNGCTESLIPSKIPQHEKHCPYMKFECPASDSTNCKWMGFMKDLCDHFEQKHPTLFLKENCFELDFVNSYKETCLLPFGEDLFLVSRSSNSNSNNFSCSVSYIGTNPYTDSYIYKIILENERKSHAHTISNKLNDKTDISIDGVRDVLSNPSSIIATIEVLEHQGAIEDMINVEDEEEESRNNGVDYELLKELECFVCFEYMLPPIHQCLTGHSICLRCKNNVEKCPTCQQEFKDTQNFALAQVINYITYPCKNKKCRFTAKAKDIKQHEANCIFSTRKCPLEDYLDCNAELVFTEIYDHIMENHYESLLEMETVSVPFDYENDETEFYEDCFIIKYSFHLFKLHYKYDPDLVEFMWAMQLIGPTEESVKYMFEIDIVDNTGKNQRAYFKNFCSPMTSSADAFDDGKSYISIQCDQIKSMITKDFTYRVRILHE